jgi:hypothetical protein
MHPVLPFPQEDCHVQARMQSYYDPKDLRGGGKCTTVHLLVRMFVA